MTDDPADGLDPEDIRELDRLFKEIVEQSDVQQELFLTDDVGLSDSIDVALTPGSVEAKADVPTPRVVTAEAHLTTRVTLTADAVVLPAGVDSETFKQMFDLARKLASNPYVSGLVTTAIYEGAHDQFIAVLHFVALVLTYLLPYA